MLNFKSFKITNVLAIIDIFVVKKIQNPKQSFTRHCIAYIIKSAFVLNFNRMIC